LPLGGGGKRTIRGGLAHRKKNPKRGEKSVLLSGDGVKTADRGGEKVPSSNEGGEADAFLSRKGIAKKYSSWDRRKRKKERDCHPPKTCPRGTSIGGDTGLVEKKGGGNGTL